MPVSYRSADLLFSVLPCSGLNCSVATIAPQFCQFLYLQSKPVLVCHACSNTMRLQTLALSWTLVMLFVYLWFLVRPYLAQVRSDCGLLCQEHMNALSYAHEAFLLILTIARGSHAWSIREANWNVSVWSCDILARSGLGPQ